MSNKKFAALLIALIITALIIPTFLIMEQISIVKKQQEDTLNQVMDIQMEIDNLKQSINANDKYIGNGTKNAETEDYGLIERVVAAEARGDTFQGMLAVCQTIKDRGDLWGMTYEEVVLQEGQFAAPYQGEISDDVKLAVNYVFEKNYRVTEEPITHFATYEPYWAEGKISRGSCGSKAHQFWY